MAPAHSIPNSVQLVDVVSTTGSGSANETAFRTVAVGSDGAEVDEASGPRVEPISVGSVTVFAQATASAVTAAHQTLGERCTRRRRMSPGSFWSATLAVVSVEELD
jgi:hypothetical protein